MGEIVGLKNKKCVPCEGGVQALGDAEVNRLAKQVRPPLAALPACIPGMLQQARWRRPVPTAPESCRRCGLLLSAVPRLACGEEQGWRGCHQPRVEGPQLQGSPRPVPEASACPAGEATEDAGKLLGCPRLSLVHTFGQTPSNLCKPRCVLAPHSGWHSGAQLRTPHPLSMSRRIAVVAEEQGHHPDLHLTGYNNVAAEMTTHAARGLTENDFIMAAKVGAGAGRRAQRIHLPQPA
jgi:hypothetical protein